MLDEKFLKKVHQHLESHSQTISTAESCTSGLLAFLLTSQPGSSRYYVGGINCYSNQIKVEQLHVPPAILQKHGAVSEEVVQYMSKGVQKNLGSEIAIATTGIAGPEGGSELKPVGTVWIGLQIEANAYQKKLVLEGDRHSIRLQSGYKALEWLLETLG